MIVLSISTLLLLAMANYLYVAKKFFYPPVIFSLIWAFDLVLILLAGDFFYSLSHETLAIVTCGALAFSFGGAMAMFLPTKPERPTYRLKDSNKLLNWCLVISLLSVGLVYRWVSSFTGGSGPSAIWAIRNAIVAMGNSGDMGSSFYENLITFAGAAATIAFLEDGRKRKLLALLVGVAMILLTGSRYGIATLLLAAMFLDWLRQGHVRWKIIGPALSSFVLLFGVMAVFLGHGDTSTEGSMVDNVEPAVALVASYASGGLVAFDRVVREPGIIPHSWQIGRGPELLLNKLGAHFDVPVIHAEYVTIGPHSLLQNVYTMYFAYYDWGITGMFALTAFIGFISTWLFRRALAGYKTAAVLCSYFVAECVLSIFNENFFIGFNYIIKLAALSWIVYSLPVHYAQFRDFVHKRAAADMIAHTLM